ncbi:MAG: hypothetical protein Q7S21_03480 [archaeon]|nr:hypothetical protein [archaeon]
MKYKKELFLILIIALVLRLAPVIVYEMPISYDAPYHERIAMNTLETGGIPHIDESLGGRTNIYPPMYSLTLAEFSLITGLSINVLGMIFLPIISALVALSVFVLVKRLRNEFFAIIAALLTAISTPLIAAAFDSPENIMLFALPLIILCIFLGKQKLGAIFYAIGFLWNYFFALINIIPIVVSYWKQKKFLISALIGIVIVGLLYVFMKGINAFSSQNPSIGIDLMLYNLKAFFPIFFPLIILLILPIIFVAGKQKLSKELRFFEILLILGIISIVAMLFSPMLRPWEQIKFMGISSIMLLCCVSSNFFKKYLVFIGIIFLIFSLMFSFQAAFPRITKTDLKAIDYLNELNSNGSILAEPSFSEHIRIQTGMNDRLLTSLYFENQGANSFLQESIAFLQNEEMNQQQFFEKTNLEYVILNYEDLETGKALNARESSEFNKIYSLNYYQPCLFSFIPKKLAYSCYANETMILEKN